MSEEKVQTKTKVPKIQDFFCAECNKRYGSNGAYKTHVKNKHTNINSRQISPEEKIILKNQQKQPQKPAIKLNSKSKGYQQYQQDCQDKIYAFLGQLGEKHLESTDKDQNESEQSDRMMGQANYLQNNVVRTPFQLQFEIQKQIEVISTQNEELNEFFKALKKQTEILNEKLIIQRDRWQFRDPIQISKFQDQEFSLINVQNVINNYKKKNIQLNNPEFSIFLLWLAKITKPAAWRQFYMIIGYSLFEYREYRTKTLKDQEKNQGNWKGFNGYWNSKLDEESIKYFESKLQILDKSDIGQFLKLYHKWVMYFSLF